MFFLTTMTSAFEVFNLAAKCIFELRTAKIELTEKHQRIIFMPKSFCVM